jgi:hypothetical protein
MVDRTRVVIYDTRIASLFDQDENAVAFLKDVIDSIIAQAQFFEVPRGNAQSGRRFMGWKSLQNSHKSTGVLRRGPLGAGGGAYNDAPHARWVHGGTPAVIVPTSSQYLSVPVPGGLEIARLQPGTSHGWLTNKAGRMVKTKPGGRILTPSVQGQEANPWLQRAGDKVVGEYRAKAYYKNWAKQGTRLTGSSG